MADTQRYTDSWETIPWRNIEREVFRLQKRIYQASRNGEQEKVHQLQRLMLSARSAKLLAVRTVTQDNTGKRTAGVDGVKLLTPQQRLALVQELGKKHRADPIRRVYIPKPNGEERALGIPTMRDRAQQVLVKLALEPQWEARFEANSYGFRPGRSAHDAIEAIFNKIRYKPNYVLDADIEKCFDRINHEKLLDKLDTITPIKRLVCGWLKAGIMDHGEMLFPEAGTPQGGVLSPLLANIALHGLEETVTQGYKRSRNMAALIRYADDFVILHHDRQVIEELRERAETFLAEMGLRLKPSKTNTTHTLQAIDGKVGFDFLGFTVRQFPQGKHQSGKNTNGKLLGFKTIITPSKEAVARHLHDVKRLLIQHRHAPREVVIIKMTRLIKGWTRYFSTVSAREAFEHAANQTFKKLMRWAQRRNKGSRRAMVDANFTQTWELKAGNRVLPRHTATPIERHIKVKGGKSPFDGDWAYWGARLGRSPLLPRQKAILLKKQSGRCSKCSLLFITKDGMEVHHRDENRENRRWDNLTLLHRHCHDQVHRGANDNG